MSGDTSSAAGRPLGRRLLPVVGALLAVLCAIYIGIGFAVSMKLSRPRRSVDPHNSPVIAHLAFEDVRFPARGGDADIAAWYMPHPTAQRAVIMIHGKDSSRFNEFRGHGPEVAAALVARELSVLMLDLRGHGQSSDARFSFGINESRDVLGGVDYLRGRGIKAGSIGLLGTSMGAATSIYAAATDPTIGAVVEDCGYSRFGPLVEAQWRRVTGLPSLFMPAVRLGGWAISGLDIMSVRPVDVIGRIAPRPVLLIHGDQDELVPVSQVYELQQALPTSELWVIPGAGHVGGYRNNPVAYTRRVGDFFDAKLPK